MFYVWFDDLNLWRRRIFASGPTRGTPESSVAGPVELPQPTT